MRGLLRKDWYVSAEFNRTWLPYALLICLLPWSVGGAYALMLSSAAARVLIANDERRWDRLAVMLPCRAEDIVWARYLVSYLYLLFGLGVTVLGLAAQGVFFRRPVGSRDLELTVLMAGVMVFLIAAGRPLLYRFSARRIHLWLNLAIIVLLSFLGTAAWYALETMTPSARHGALAAAAALAAAGTWASFRLSVRFYERRRKGVYQ